MRLSRFARWALALSGALCLISTVPAWGQSRPNVAVIDLDFGTVQQWWSGNWDIGKGIADLIVDELVNDGSYRVIDRKRLETILAEQDFSNSDRADPDAKTMARIGKVLGVKYLIVGTITKFGLENKDTRVNAGAWTGNRFGLGDVGRTKGKANVGLTAKIIDTSTAEIMASAKGDGTSNRTGLLLGGGGGAGGTGAIGGVSITSSDFHDTILGEATEQAVKALAQKLVAAKGRLSGTGK